jgi:hypothetical protein
MEYLKLLHGLYNTLVVLLFIRQGWLGLGIRKNRVHGRPPNLTAIKKHRRAGPALALMAGGGYLAGLILSYFDHGDLIHFPSHFMTGTALVLLIGSTYLVSRQIRGLALPWRNGHAALGTIILTLYPIQVYFGLGIFL